MARASMTGGGGEGLQGGSHNDESTGAEVKPGAQVAGCFFLQVRVHFRFTKCSSHNHEISTRAP